MRISWRCVVFGHDWHQYADDNDAVTEFCHRCGERERIALVYMGRGAGIVRTVDAVSDGPEPLATR
jgi:hypothetical protein